jgi:EmrB/QacA subfamily drug resistance transporter
MSDQAARPPLEKSPPATPAAPSTGSSVPERLTRRRQHAVLGVLCVTLLLISLDNTVLNVALPSIVRSLGASQSELQWAVDAYALTFAGLLLPMGSLGDRVGRKWVYMAGLAVFGCGSAFAAWSGRPITLIFARAVMGVGAAALMPGTLSILTNVFTGEGERARAIGIWSGTAGVGVALGPILGGVLLTHFWWGSVFLINVPIAVAGLVASVWLVPNSRNPGVGRPDALGGALSVLGLATLVWAIIEAPERGWSSPFVLGALGGALLLLAVFVWRERSIEHPMLPLALLRDRRVSVALSILGLALFAMMGMFFLVTEFLQFELGYSPLATGIRIAPVAVTVLVFAPLAVFAARRVGVKAVVGFGLGIVALGLGLLSMASTATTYGQALIPFVLIGSGVALSLSPCTASVLGSLPLEQAGVGSATNDTAMQLGAALGVGVVGTALNFRYRDLLGPPLVAAHVPAGIRNLVEGSLGASLAAAQRAPAEFGRQLTRLARHAFISGMDLGLLVTTGVVAGAAVVAVLFLPNWALGSSSRREHDPEVGHGAEPRDRVDTPA